MAKPGKKSKYQPYAQAKATALDLQLNSRSQYIKWHTDNNIQYLPRYPERVYKEWESWNDYLGTANIFRGDIQKKVRPMWEAVKWVHQFADTHNLNTMNEWLAYTKEHEDELPEDITIRPDQHYVEWKTLGWVGWLGTDARARLRAARESTALFAICSHHNLRMPGNKYALVQAEQGPTQMISILNQHSDLRLVRCYKMVNEMKEEVMELIQKYGRDDGDGWFIPNVNDVIFELDQLLDVYVHQSGITVG